jgi:hypothetical protein
LPSYSPIGIKPIAQYLSLARAFPLLEKSKQNTPHFTSEVIAGIPAHSKGYKQMFCALPAGTGLRAPKGDLDSNTPATSKATTQASTGSAAGSNRICVPADS